MKAGRPSTSSSGARRASRGSSSSRTVSPPRGRGRAGHLGESCDIAVGPVRSRCEFPKIATGPDGRFRSPRRMGFLLIAVSDAGYADASSDEFAKSGKLVLQPWGRIEGGVRIGPRQGANQEVVFDPTRPEGRVGIGGFELRLLDVDRRAGTLPIRPGDPRPGTVARVVGQDVSPGASSKHCLAGRSPSRSSRAGRPR